MSLYKKSQEILYKDFLQKTLGLAGTPTEKKLSQLGWSKLLQNVEKVDAYERYVVPCLVDERIRTEGGAAVTRVKIIERKLRLLDKHFKLQNFYFYTVNARRHKVDLLYGRRNGKKVREEMYERSLILSKLAERVLLQKKITPRQLRQALEQGLVASGLMDTEKKNYFFHALRKGTRTYAIIVLELEREYVSHDHVEQPVKQLLDYAFLPDIRKIISKGKQDADQVQHSTFFEKRDLLLASGHLDFACILSDYINELMSCVEKLEYAQGIEQLMELFALKLVVIFDRKDEQDTEEEIAKQFAMQDDFAASVDFEANVSSTDLKIEHGEVKYYLSRVYGLVDQKHRADLQKADREYTGEELTDGETSHVLAEVLGGEMEFFSTEHAVFYLDVVEDHRILVAMDPEEADIFIRADAEKGLNHDGNFLRAFITGMIYFLHRRSTT